MATFTSSEKRQIRSYLGYSGAYRDMGVALESVMDTIANQTDEAAYCRSLLSQIDAVDTALASSGTGGSSASYGAVKKVDEIEFYDITTGSVSNTTLSGVAYGDILIERLRALLGVELAGRYFHKSPGNQFAFGPR